MTPVFNVGEYKEYPHAEIRKYLVEYQTINNCGKVTIDNIRRSLSTFFFVARGRGLYYKKPNEKNS